MKRGRLRNHDRDRDRDRDRKVEQIGSDYEALVDLAGASRRHGTHYTPRALAEQVVDEALRPLLDRPGQVPTPAQVLKLKVCDPAMGAGAFLLSACRALGERLEAAWKRHGAPAMPAGVDPTLHARRLVAGRCLYGVDLDPIAVELARVSLQMLTQADGRLCACIGRALLHGDALVGLDWEISFPEVFSRRNPGFDAMVGNPPFAGKNTLLSTHGKAYLDALQALHPGSHGNADIVAHFFRRAFTLSRRGGTIGFIATNTIAQGDTRASGLQWICRSGGVIYGATRRLPWPGRAAVVVSVVHVHKDPPRPVQPILDGKPASRISAFLVDRKGDEAPAALPENAGKSFIGSYVLGMGFTFDDTAEGATPLDEMRRLIARDPRNGERIFPYLGGEELNSSPTHAPHRHVINFEQMTEEQARAWPELLAIVEAKVKPQRDRLRDNPDGRRRKRCWWQWGRYTPALFEAIRGMDRVLVTARVSEHAAFVFVPTGQIFSEQLVVFAMPSFSAFAVLQSRVHELWTRAFASSLEERRRYTPSDCFETFPFPAGWEADARLERIGEIYHRRRAEIMVRRGEGLTAVYNRFHDPGERDPGILELRRIQDAMDRAVLDAYGWGDLRPRCAFLPAGRCRWSDRAGSEVLERLLSRSFAPRDD